MAAEVYFTFQLIIKRNMKLWNAEKIIFSESSGLNPTLGIQWESDSDSLVMELDSGNYNFTWKGDNPQIGCLDSRISTTKDNAVLLEYSNSTDVYYHHPLVVIWNP